LSVSYVDDAQLQLKSKIERRLVNLRRQHERVIGEAKRLKRVIATLEQEHEKLAPSQMCVIM
jgi:phage shock protein A